MNLNSSTTPSPPRWEACGFISASGDPNFPGECSGSGEDFMEGRNLHPDAAREARGVGAGGLPLGKGMGLPAIVGETLVKNNTLPLKMWENETQEEAVKYPWASLWL